MNNNNDKRRNRRYNISEYVKEDYFKDISLEINSDIVALPKIMDVSLNGLGFALEDSSGTINLDEFDKMSDYFINIRFVNKVILAEVKKVWSIIIEEAGKRILKGGFAFSVISPEDRLSLAEYINTLRH